MFVKNENAVKKSRFRLTPKGMGVNLALLVGSMIPEANPNLRWHLPEPFDILSHLSNFGTSSYLGYITGAIAGNLSLRRHRGAEGSVEQIDIKRAHTAMLAAGVVLGATINALYETKYGLSLMHSQTVADPIDFVYGVAGAAFGSAVMPEFHQPQATNGLLTEK